MQHVEEKVLRLLPSRIQRAALPGRIRGKWERDRRSLPLEEAHRALYMRIHEFFWNRMKHFPNLANPQSLNEKMQWLKLFDQDHAIIRCSDKIAVRDHVKERVGAKYLPELYQTGRCFSDIAFAALPSHFVIKANHDSGSVALVNDDLSPERLRDLHAFFDNALSHDRFGWDAGEWAYHFIEPKILVEEHLNREARVHPSDYKFYCVEGRVEFCHFIYDRHANVKEQTIDRHGRDLKQSLYPSFELGTSFVKPPQWEEMIEVAEAISRGFKFVRVDLYNVGNRIAAGEMTFWPMAGVYQGSGQKILGGLLKFDTSRTKPPIFRDSELLAVP